MGRSTVLRYAPLLTTGCGLVVVLALCQALFQREDAQLLSRTDAEARHIALQIQNGLQTRIDPLERIAEWWLRQGRPLPEDWTSDAQLFIRANNGLENVLWLNAAGRPSWSVPEDPLVADNADPLRESLRRTVEWAHIRRRTALSDVVDDHFFVCVPVYRWGRLEGYMAGLYNVTDLLNGLLKDQLPPDYHVTVLAAGRPIYGAHNATSHPAPQRTRQSRIFVRNAAWTARVWLSADPLEYYERLILAFGTVIAGLLYLSAMFAVLSRRRAAALEAANRDLQREMTERRRAEDQIAELNVSLSGRLADFETLLEVIPIGIAVSRDPQCREIWINPALARMMGVPRSANISKSAPQAQQLNYELRRNGQEIPADLLPMQVAGRTGREVLGEEMEIVRPDGQVLETLSFASPLFDPQGRVRGVLNACIDITERKRAELERTRLLEREQAARLHAELALSALHASEDKFRRLVDSDVIGFMMIDSRQVLEANDSLLRMLGYNREELAAGLLRWPDMTPPEYRDLDQQWMAGLRAAGRFGPVEKELLRKDGTRLPVLVGGTLLEDSFQWTCVCFVLDLSQRRELENRLRRAQKLESLGIMAAGIAHDFNNLLTVILGNASLAYDVLPPRHEVRERLASVIQAGERGADVVSQILAYTGRAHYEIAALDLSELVRQMRPVVREAVPDRIDLQFDLAANLPAVGADGTEIQQTLIRLVVNAAEAIGEEPGSISISTALCALDSRRAAECYPDQDLAPGMYVCLAVADTGCGMPAEIASRIFDPFFTTKFTGRGLGLSAVLGAMRAHGGGVRVESSPVAGTRFELVFPIELRARPAAV